MGRSLHCPGALSSELTHLPRGRPRPLHLKMSGDREAIALETVLNRNWALQVQRQTVPTLKRFIVTIFKQVVFENRDSLVYSK